MNREEIELELLKLELQRNKQQLEQEKDIWQQDKNASIREISRRNIETCISVIKCCNTTNALDSTRVSQVDVGLFHEVRIEALTTIRENIKHLNHSCQCNC